MRVGPERNNTAGDRREGGGGDICVARGVWAGSAGPGSDRTAPPCSPPPDSHAPHWHHTQQTSARSVELCGCAKASAVQRRLPLGNVDGRLLGHEVVEEGLERGEAFEDGLADVALHTALGLALTTDALSGGEPEDMGEGKRGEEVGGEGGRGAAAALEVSGEADFLNMAELQGAVDAPSQRQPPRWSAPVDRWISQCTAQLRHLVEGLGPAAAAGMATLMGVQ